MSESNGAVAEPVAAQKPKLVRTTFTTSRLLDFCTEKGLTTQTGHPPDAWPLVVLKELLDNSMDAAEDADLPPEISVAVDDDGITVSDNGPGIPPETVGGVLDFSVRVSSREAYVAPDRGKQGNALKTIMAMPYVLDGNRGRVEITACGVRHDVTIMVDRIRGEPVIEHQQHDAGSVKNGTSVKVWWPEASGTLVDQAHSRFLQIAGDYTFLNPHLTLTVDWHGARDRTAATSPKWPKWRPCEPTCVHWYTLDRFMRLLSAYIAHDADHGKDRLVRVFVEEFLGLKATSKQKAVLVETDLARKPLSALRSGNGLNEPLAAKLLGAMKKNSKPVKPARLGLIGKSHLQQRFQEAGCMPESFEYRKEDGYTDGVPWVIEAAFGYRPKGGQRTVTGVNWSPGILNPFRELGKFGRSLDEVLAQQRAGRGSPIVYMLHGACPKVDYSDYGKSAVVIGGDGRCDDDEDDTGDEEE